jgi:hypothetical protein
VSRNALLPSRESLKLTVLSLDPVDYLLLLPVSLDSVFPLLLLGKLSLFFSLFLTSH